MPSRIAKTLLAASAGLLILLVGINNLIDYGTNFAIVEHVLAMDSLPAGAALTWRAITSPIAHHLVYGFIIAVELGAGALTLRGADQMRRALRATSEKFTASKQLAVLGLALGFWLYFFGFMTVGAEWFQMWRSQTVNMQEPAFRFIGMIGLVMIFVGQGE